MRDQGKCKMVQTSYKHHSHGLPGGREWSKTPIFGHHVLGRVFSPLCGSLAPPRQWIHVVPGQMGKYKN